MDQPVDLGRTDRISWPPKNVITDYILNLKYTPRYILVFKYYTIPCNMKAGSRLTLLLLLLLLHLLFFICLFLRIHFVATLLIHCRSAFFSTYRYLSKRYRARVNRRSRCSLISLVNMRTIRERIDIFT